MLAAQEMGIPVWAPGWEDSTTGNMFAANVFAGNVPHHQCVKSGTEQFQGLIEWYLGNHGGGKRPSVGFFQIGGGIAGDFAICTVPSIIQDLQMDVPFWGYFAQITDITRDQQLSQDAIATYTLLITNYPKSEYAKDAREKMVIAVDQLAGKEMSVGRYYAGNGQYAAAINRFRVVVDKYQTSTHIEEALFRLTESNLALGLTAEAQTAAAVLGHNYPSSDWYKESLTLLQKVGLEPKVNSASPLATSLQG